MPSAEREAWSQKTFRRIPWSPEIQLVCWEARSSWRRRRDSNPRYGNTPYGGLANRWFQPLTHVSERGSGSAAIVARFQSFNRAASARNAAEPHRQAHLLARIEHPHPELRPLLLRGVERGVGV